MPDASHVGRVYRAPGQVIEGDRARAFAAAIAGDDAVAEPDAVPPTYAAVYCLFPTLGRLFGDAEVGLNLAGLVHGEQRFTFDEPVRPGDVVDAEARIASVDEKRGMTFLGIEMEASREDGRRVCTGRALLIVRGGATAGAGAAPAPPAGSPQGGAPE
jgi:acyl dehydratase